MKHSGPAPFGFAWQDGRLVLVENEAETRRLAFELYLKLHNKAAVAQHLNATGHMTRRGSKWRDVTVGRLLACSSARGLYARNRTGADNAGQPVQKPEDEWEFLECPSIVSIDLWERVHRMIVTERPHAPPRSGSHPFTGVLFCHCGGRMNLTSTEQKFVCSKCGDRIPVPDLEERFLDEVTTFVRTRQNQAAEFLEVDASTAEQSAVLRDAERRKQRLDEEILKTERLYMENRISLDRFEKMHRPLEHERRAVERELKRQNAKLVSLKTKGGVQPDSSFDPNTIRQRWSSILPGARRQIVRTFVRQIVVTRDEIEFTYPFRDSSERATSSQHFHRPTISRTGVTDDEPVYIRLPKPGQLCSRTGMTRAALNELILPNDRNGFVPPVESKSLRKRDGGKGIRLIVWQSLKEYLSTRQ